MSRSNDESDESLHDENEEDESNDDEVDEFAASSDIDGDYYEEDLDDDDLEPVEKLMNMFLDVDVEVERERRDFLQKLSPLIADWDGDYPDLGDIFETEEIDCLLSEAVTCMNKRQDDPGKLFLEFVVSCGYKDEPGADVGRRRSTAVHRAARREFFDEIVRELFKIYAKIEVNYADELGLTHFHAACQSGCKDIVVKFLELGVDPNLRVPESGNSSLHLTQSPEVFELLLRRGAEPNAANHMGFTPLHVICERNGFQDDDLAESLFKVAEEKQLEVLVDARDWEGWTPLHMSLCRGHRHLTELLLRRGADPNAAADDGSTPLHIICTDCIDESELSQILFGISDEKQRVVRVDAVDAKGRTPLQMAVANFLLDTVETLLDRGADLSSFVFPSGGQLAAGFRPHLDEVFMNFKLRIASGALVVVERLEKRGYELDRAGALQIMEFYNKYQLWNRSADLYARLLGNEEFASRTKNTKINKSSLTLYDLLRMRPAEATKRLACTDYFQFARESNFISLPETGKSIITTHLCEILSRRFFRRWALDCFQELIRYRLPILCCDSIVEKLMNEDLWRICVAAALGQSHEQDSDNKSVKTKVIKRNDERPKRDVGGAADIEAGDPGYDDVVDRPMHDRLVFYAAAVLLHFRRVATAAAVTSGQTSRQQWQRQSILVSRVYVHAVELSGCGAPEKIGRVRDNDDEKLIR
ncbi:unnamed protein product [Trichogramma brassicae]|uniref:Uncharacterized protein n=1 Tax=Trichogramma brassicae TaxID=86971 RepID=A0A6H5ILU5_9HYME|nr:unnamed protein product [Trichogramma brassicae]